MLTLKFVTELSRTGCPGCANCPFPSTLRLNHSISMCFPDYAGQVRRKSLSASAPVSCSRCLGSSQNQGWSEGGVATVFRTAIDIVTGCLPECARPVCCQYVCPASQSSPAHPDLEGCVFSSSVRYVICWLLELSERTLDKFQGGQVLVTTHHFSCYRRSNLCADCLLHHHQLLLVDLVALEHLLGRYTASAVTPGHHHHCLLPRQPGHLASHGLHTTCRGTAD